VQTRFHTAVYTSWHAHAHWVSKTRLTVFTVYPSVLMWWDTQADNTGPEVQTLRVWSQAAKAGWGWATGTDGGARSLRCAVCLITGWMGPRDLLAGQRWTLTLPQQALTQCSMLSPKTQWDERRSSVNREDWTTSPLDLKNVAQHSSAQWRTVAGEAWPASGHMQALCNQNEPCHASLTWSITAVETLPFPTAQL